MLFASDDDDFPVKCPRCLNEFHEKVGRLKTGAGTRCTDAACGANLRLTAEQFARARQEAQESPKRWFRQLARLRPPE